MKIKIYVATYTDPSGYPFQKVFKKKSEAKKWLRKQYDRDFDDAEFSDNGFEDWCKYGGWMGKIKQHTVTV